MQVKKFQNSDEEGLDDAAVVRLLMSLGRRSAGGEASNSDIPSLTLTFPDIETKTL
jgi:hypothetical protein